MTDVATVRCAYSRLVALNREVLAQLATEGLWTSGCIGPTRHDERLADVAHTMARASLTAMTKDFGSTVRGAVLHEALATRTP